MRLIALIAGLVSLSMLARALAPDQDTREAVRLIARDFSQAHQQEIGAVLRQVALERAGRTRVAGTLVIACSSEGGCRE